MYCFVFQISVMNSCTVLSCIHIIHMVIFQSRTFSHGGTRIQFRRHLVWFIVVAWLCVQASDLSTMMIGDELAAFTLHTSLCGQHAQNVNYLFTIVDFSVSLHYICAAALLILYCGMYVCWIICILTTFSCCMSAKETRNLAQAAMQVDFSELSFPTLRSPHR